MREYQVKAQCCSVPDNDIASTSHMAKTDCRTPNVHLAATFAPHHLHITTGALRTSNNTLAHLARSFGDPVEPGSQRRRASHLFPYARDSAAPS